MPSQDQCRDATSQRGLLPGTPMLDGRTYSHFVPKIAPCSMPVLSIEPGSCLSKTSSTANDSMRLCSVMISADLVAGCRAQHWWMEKSWQNAVVLEVSEASTRSILCSMHRLLKSLLTKWKAENVRRWRASLNSILCGTS